MFMMGLDLAKQQELLVCTCDGKERDGWEGDTCQRDLRQETAGGMLYGVHCELSWKAVGTLMSLHSKSIC